MCSSNKIILQMRNLYENSIPVHVQAYFFFFFAKNCFGIFIILLKSKTGLSMEFSILIKIFTEEWKIPWKVQLYFKVCTCIKVRSLIPVKM